MEKSFWLKKWECKDIGFHREVPNANLVNTVDKMDLSASSRFLVPLCGKSKDMLWLMDKGYDVVGVELSHIACQEFFAELNVTPEITKRNSFTRYSGPHIELLCGDFFDLTPEDLPRIDVVYDCRAFIALPSEMRSQYVSQLTRCIGTKNKILLIAIESHCKVTGPPFPVYDSEINDLYGSNYHVNKIKSESVIDIPANLIPKGYTQLVETVYLISGKT